MKKKQRGFALLLAVIFMAVVLSFGLALSSLGYKQEVLASTAIESQYAFYAADAALECALYADQQQADYTYATHGKGSASFPNPPPNPIVCDGRPSTQVSYSYDATQLVDEEQVSLDSGTAAPRCADVTVYKYSSPQPLGCTTNCITTYVFSQGYDVSCTTVNASSGAQFASRGLSYHY
ncbi:MAG: pilus assembly PilX family protein [Minisyncoccota bacterium]